MVIVVPLQPQMCKVQARQDSGEGGIYFYTESDRLWGEGKERKEEWMLSGTQTPLQGSSFIQFYSITSSFVMTEFYPLIYHLHVDLNKYHRSKVKRCVRKRYALCSSTYLGERPTTMYRHVPNSLSLQITSGNYL